MIHSTQVCIPLKPLFSRHKGAGVQFTDELIGNIKAVARIFGQRGTEELFGSSAVIDVGGVVVVYAAFHGRVYDCLRLFVINIGAAAAGGQTHGAHSQPRKRDLVFEIFVLHANTPFI